MSPQRSETVVLQARTFTSGARKPASLRLTFRNGMYAIDHVDTTETSILMELVRSCDTKGRALALASP